MLNTMTVGDRWAVLTRRACPCCGSMKTSRGHRRSMLDDALAAIRVFPYRCGRCSTRFHALSIIRALGEKPWSADSRASSIRQRCSADPSVIPVAVLSALVILLISGVATILLLTINGLAVLSLLY